MALALEVAEAIISAARDKARDLGATISVAVVDQAGYLIAFGRMDGGPWPHAEIAIAKAKASAILNRSGTQLLESQRLNPHVSFQVQFLTKGQLFREKGSMPIHDADGNVLGAVGVSGSSSEDDEAIANAALESLGGS